VGGSAVALLARCVRRAGDSGFDGLPVDEDDDSASSGTKQQAPAGQIVDLGAMEAELMVPGLTQCFAVGQHTTVTLFDYKAGGASEAVRLVRIRR